MFGKLMLASICVPLLYFGLVPGAGILDTLKFMALGTVASVTITIVYPEIRGIKNGDAVAVVSDPVTPSLIGKPGMASEDAKKNQRLKVKLDSGGEVLGVVESYIGIISPPRIRLIYEEKLVEQ
jgi:hypothetical protein